jgi:hypothetical protein
LEKGLVDYQKEEWLCTIIDKGMHFLQVYSQLNQLKMGNDKLMRAAAKEYQNVE